MARLATRLRPSRSSRAKRRRDRSQGPHQAGCLNPNVTIGLPRMDDLKALIREVPDFPKPGILFYDITTLLKDKGGLHTTIDALCTHYNGKGIDIVLGIEARGF